MDSNGISDDNMTAHMKNQTGGILGYIMMHLAIKSGWECHIWYLPLWVYKQLLENWLGLKYIYCFTLPE